jgi:adenosylhomocysteine nucleosidase
MFASEPGCATKRPPLRDCREDGVVAILTAMPEEFDAISGPISDGERLRRGKGVGRFLLRGRMAGVPVLLAMTGDGNVRAGSGVSFLLRESPVSLLVGAGAAGALVPSLRAGDLVVARRVIDGTGEAPPPDASFVARAVALGAIPATVLTLSKPICSSTEKKNLALRFGFSDSEPAVVDTESAAWVRAAAGRGLPYVLLRAVSDTLEDELPAFLSSCLSPEGSVDRSTVARRLILRPAALPVLLRMRRRVRDGAGALALFLERLLPEVT